MYNRYIPQGDFIPAESAEQGGERIGRRAGADCRAVYSPACRI